MDRDKVDRNDKEIISPNTEDDQSNLCWAAVKLPADLIKCLDQISSGLIKDFNIKIQPVSKATLAFHQTVPD